MIVFNGTGKKTISLNSLYIYIGSKKNLNLSRYMVIVNNVKKIGNREKNSTQSYLMHGYSSTVSRRPRLTKNDLHQKVIKKQKIKKTQINNYKKRKIFP